MLTESMELTSSVTIPVILDPACGSGQFLINAYKKLYERLSSMGESHEDIPKIIMSHYLIGIDSDPLAVMIAKYNLHIISGLEEKEIKIIHGDYLYKDSLSLTQESHDLKADIIIGNPPWGSKCKLSEKQYYSQEYLSPKSGINSFTLFIERSYEFLPDNGIISFLVPEAFLNIKAHQKARLLMTKHGILRSLTLWGEQFRNVFAPSVSFIFQKDKSMETARESLIIRKSKNPSIVTLVPQEKLLTGPDNNININYSSRSCTLLSTIDKSDTFTLKHRAKFFLGIVTGNNSRHISPKNIKSTDEPIIVGKDLEQFRINQGRNYISFNPAELQQTAPQKLYKTRDKLVYRFIGKRLTFALDREGHYMLNNVNGIIANMDDYWPETLVTLFNSRMMQFYYETNFYTVKVLRGNLEALPIKNFARKTRRELKRYHDEMLEADKLDTIFIYNRINEIINREYGINDTSFIDSETDPGGGLLF
jgi:methylase of polypeptide subunit release factors